MLSNMALGTLAPVIASRARASWIGYGLALYVGLRLARRYGIGGDLPDRALNVIDDAVGSAIASFGQRRKAAV